MEIKQQRKEIDPKVMKRGRTEPINEEAAAEDPWIWIVDEIPTSEEMRNRKRTELAERFAKEMETKPSPWKFWFPKHEETEWETVFKKKGFVVKDRFNHMKSHPMGGTRCLYQVKINTKKKQKKVEEEN